MSRKLTDKVIVITGASSGIGAATARLCYEAGMRVVCAARRTEMLEQVVEPMGVQGLAVACDVRDDQQVAALFEQTIRQFGRLDVIFANAGYGLNRRVDRTSNEQAHDLFETNFFGTLHCIRHGLPLLRQTEAGLRHILICSSAASDFGLPNYGLYAASKASQKSVAQAMRAELQRENFSVTSVHPVGTRTEFFQAAAVASGRPEMRNRTNTPMMFEQTAEQVAGKILKAIRRPKAEVWPQPLARFGLGLLVMFPGLCAFVMRRKAVTRQTGAKSVASSGPAESNP
ncbi:MAG: SDR family NAD(P)-dependent oxidoreductase [Phycisphaeraceae bacterium]|nr:SDR family NAD(P)-dependent oxidoreductase [Phycisphaeraceae bacterium]